MTQKPRRILTHFRSIAPHAAAYLLYLLIAILITYPVITVFSTRYIGHPFSDSYELTRHIWWIQHTLQRGLPVLPQPLLAYPDGLDGALLWSYPLQSFPAWLFAFVMPLPSAYNLMVLLRIALNGWAAYWLARHLTGGQTIPALLAGAVFMTYPTFQGHLAAGHPGLLALWPFVFYAYALIRLRETGQRRYLLFGALFFVMSTWGSTQLAVFTLAPFTAVFALALLARREWGALARVFGAALLGGLLSLIFAVPLLRVSLQAEPTPAYHVVVYSADMLGVVAPSFEHPLFRGSTISGAVLGIDPFEMAAYIGMVAALLSLIALFKRRESRWWGLLALVAWIASLGPLMKWMYSPVSAAFDGYATRVPLPYALIYDLPLIDITRTPGRFNFVVALALAVMAAYGVAFLLERFRARWMRVLALVLAALVVYEYQFWWNDAGTFPDMPTVPGVVPEPIAALSQRDDIRAVFDIPFRHHLVAKQGLWLQTGHQRPLIAGHMTRQTPVNPAKLAILQATLDPALLDAAGVDIIIVHRAWDTETGEVEALARARLGEPFYEGESYVAFDAPVADDSPQFVALPAADSDIAERVDSYLFAPEPLTVEFSARLEADGREVALLLDGTRVAGWTVAGEMDALAAVPVEAGYHTLSLVVEPPCPPNVHYTLECRAVDILALTMTAGQGEEVNE